MSHRTATIAALLLGGFALSAHAETINITQQNTWYQFDVDEFVDDQLRWIALDGSLLSFSLSLAAPAWVTVVDAGFGGDSYSIFDNGNLIGLTSAGANTYPGSVVLDFDAALANSSYGYATFLLGAGTHVITGALAQSALADGFPLNASVGGIKVVSEVPLPATGLLMLLGTGALGALGRRGKKKEA
jgi:hypothetical protein